MTSTAPDTFPAEELLAAATEIVTAAAADGITMRLLGGIAVYHLAQSSREPDLERAYHDFDVVVSSKDSNAAARIFRAHGYGEDREFNAIHGAQRMIFGSDRGFVVDVMVGTFRMCHQLDLGHNLPPTGLTVDPADLLLTKLQIVQIEGKDLLDASALLIDLPVDASAPIGINPQRFARALAADWGFHHTVQLNLPKLAAYASARFEPPRAATVAQATEALEAAMLEAPKTARWKMRARVGERISWYDLPEEL